jgi:hypothetical protein
MHSLGRNERLILTCLALSVFTLISKGETASTGQIVKRPREIEFTATVNTGPFDSGGTMPGYHAIVWKGGRMAHAGLLQAEVSDREVLEALESLGARPGDNLPMETWEERNDSKSRAPDTAVAGPGVEVLLRLPGRQDLLPLASALQDPAGRGVAMRFGGNAANIPKRESGCIVCLYSCPGSKVGNAKYTVRDYVKSVNRFCVRPGILPPDGTPIRVVLRLTE